jgi:hypothetical protein
VLTPWQEQKYPILDSTIVTEAKDIVFPEVDTDKDVVAIDLETTGLKFWDHDQHILGIGIATKDYSAYFSFVHDPKVKPSVLSWLKGKRLTSFNWLFDQAWLWRDMGKIWLRCAGDTYGMFKHLATEGFEGQLWNLETVETEILSWPGSHKEQFDKVLKDLGLSKDRMADVPVDQLGTYCALDAQAHYQAYLFFMNLIRDNWERWGKTYLQYHRQGFITEIKLLIEQEYYGIKVDRQGLTAYRDSLAKEEESLILQFMTHPDTQAWQIEARQRELSGHCFKEPPKTTKDGKESKKYKAWELKYEALQRQSHVNINSTRDLARLFHDHLKYPVLVRTQDTYQYGELIPKGAPVISKKTYGQFGELGQILLRYSKVSTELGFCEAYLAALDKNDILHPHCRSVGTTSGRLSGGDEE